MRLCFDEKPQMQALARTQAGLPATAGHPATRTHDYVRHGTFFLRAALDLDTGRIYYACAARKPASGVPGLPAPAGPALPHPAGVSGPG